MSLPILNIYKMLKTHGDKNQEGHFQMVLSSQTVLRKS